MEELLRHSFCVESHIVIWYWKKGKDQIQEISSSLNKISKLDTEHNSSTEHLLSYESVATFTFSQKKFSLKYFIFLFHKIAITLEKWCNIRFKGYFN